MRVLMLNLSIRCIVTKQAPVIPMLDPAAIICEYFEIILLVSYL